MDWSIPPPYSRVTWRRYSREYIHHFVLVYIDDIFVYSRNEAEHRLHFSEVLQRLREHQLYLKAEKCMFHQASIQFLGYQISSQGIKMDEGKVEAIKTWPIPTTIKELQRFLGFSNFDRCFIHNYSCITAPLTNLLKGKPKSLSWTPEATSAMKTLQKAFYVGSTPGPSWPREVLHSLSGCLNIWSWSRPVSTAGESSSTPSRSLLLPEIILGRTKLWYWE